MSSTVSVLMVTHSLEVMVWALAYWIVGLAPSSNSLVYFAFVNYTTLGYGDVTPAERWQLLGPITAMNYFCLAGRQLLFSRSCARQWSYLLRRASNDPRDDSQASPAQESAWPIGAAFLDGRFPYRRCRAARAPGAGRHGPDTKSTGPRHRA
jgi:hypothetical protein